MGWLRLLRTPRCGCGSGQVEGFCSHRTATRQGSTRNGRREVPTLRAQRVSPRAPKTPKR